MNKENYTSLELSKKLQENGFKGGSSIKINENGTIMQSGRNGWRDGYRLNDEFEYDWDGEDLYNTYDILNDLCIRYAKEIFGDVFATSPGSGYLDQAGMLADILQLILDGKKQEAEDYIREYCLFNPKNKS